MKKLVLVTHTYDIIEIDPDHSDLVEKFVFYKSKLKYDESFTEAYDKILKIMISLGYVDDKSDFKNVDYDGPMELTDSLESDLSQLRG